VVAPTSEGLNMPGPTAAVEHTMAHEAMVAEVVMEGMPREAASVEAPCMFMAAATIVDAMMVAAQDLEELVVPVVLVVGLPMIQLVFCRMWVQGVTTDKKQITGMWDKVQGILKWSRCRQIFGPTFALA